MTVRLFSGLAFCLAAVIFAFAFAASVLAHAAPAKVVPGNGAVLTSSPPEVRIEMTQELARQGTANDIDVIGPDGAEITTVAATIDSTNRKIIAVPLPPNLPTGKYTVRWKTLSSDDADPASGEELSFTVDPAAAPSPGQEVVRESAGGGSASPTPGVPDTAGPSVGQREDGVTWVAVSAVGLGTFALGSGGTFLLMRRQPGPGSKGGSER